MASRRKMPPARRSRLRRITRCPRLPPRRRDAHKGDFGRVLVIGGSQGMVGAPALAANAALRAGAGLATVACPATIQFTVAALCPCATSMPLPDAADGLIDFAAATAYLRAGGWLDADRMLPAVVAIGPGLGAADGAFAAGVVDLIAAFAGAGAAVVVDADALNAMARAGAAAAGSTGAEARGNGDDSGTPTTARAIAFERIVLTPHPGEMARLAGQTVRDVQADRINTAVELARRCSGAVVVLKGARTVVTDGAACAVNSTGNPGMATGGTGDVLTGVIAGLIAQGMPRLDAAVLGVRLHGLAGDLAARRLGQHSLIATDLIDFLPDAFRRIARAR